MRDAHTYSRWQLAVALSQFSHLFFTRCNWTWQSTQTERCCCVCLSQIMTGGSGYRARLRAWTHPALLHDRQIFSVGLFSHEHEPAPQGTVALSKESSDSEHEERACQGFTAIPKLVGPEIQGSVVSHWALSRCHCRSATAGLGCLWSLTPNQSQPLLLGDRDGKSITCCRFQIFPNVLLTGPVTCVKFTNHKRRQRVAWCNGQSDDLSERDETPYVPSVFGFTSWLQTSRGMGKKSIVLFRAQPRVNLRDCESNS